MTYKLFIYISIILLAAFNIQRVSKISEYANEAPSGTVVLCHACYRFHARGCGCINKLILQSIKKNFLFSLFRILELYLLCLILSLILRLGLGLILSFGLILSLDLSLILVLDLGLILLGLFLSGLILSGLILLGLILLGLILLSVCLDRARGSAEPR